MDRCPNTGIDYRTLHHLAEHSAWFLPLSELMHRTWPWLKPDDNPMPRFRLFRRSRPAPPRCTGDPCICTNGIGCVTVPMELW